MIFRFFDIVISLVALIILFPIFFILLIVLYFDTGFPLFRQSRLGKNKIRFKLIKFRTMHLNTVSVSTHLITDSAVTDLGKILRKIKLDEIPQLWNVLIGDMSIVGPRPNLPSQFELIKERDKYNVYDVKPGITGLSQVNKIDMSNPVILAKTDARMISEYSIFKYFKYLILTIMGKGFGDNVNVKK